MSEQLRHKMIEFEATPPLAAWKTIAERLDDDRQYTVVAEKMNNFTAPIPPTSWLAISTRLNDDTEYAVIASKMNGFDTIVPPAAWEAIEARLDDDNQYAAVATKMNNFDTPPPQQIWNNIDTALHGIKEQKEQPVPVISMRTTFYRVAAAAVIIGLIIGSWVFINSNTVKVDLVKNNPTPATVPPVVTEQDKTADHNSNQQKDKTAAVQNNSKNQNSASAAPLQSDYHDHILKYAVVSLPSFHETPIVISSSPIMDKEGNIIRDMDVLTTSNYLVVMGPNGQLTRISSKFASVIRYLNGTSDDPEEYLDKVIKESDTWKKRFQEWRSKISQSSFIPSSSNFLDIIEFKELIQEKQ